MRDLAVLILAAGKGERMRSELPKVLQPLGGRPLLSYSLEIAKSLKPKKTIVLVGHKADEVRAFFEKEAVEWVLQEQQLGTAHAVLCAMDSLKDFHGQLLILYGDVPLLRQETLEEMIRIARWDHPSMVLLTTHRENPAGYGRIIRNAAGEIQKIVEEKEAKDWEKEVTEINSGISLVQVDALREPLKQVEKSIVKGEYYLTDVIEAFILSGKKVSSLLTDCPGEVMGVNSRKELAEAENVLQTRIRDSWMEKGVTMISPESIRIEPQVELSPDVILHPGVILTGKTRVARGAEILAYSVIEESEVGEKARLGPFAHLRPGSVVGPESHVGNFVELKKTKLGHGSKANHLAYLGDATIGDRVNVGAGTITCNYDGVNKYQTIIEDGVFIGSDTQLVAPVTVGKGAYVGAGTTVTKDVPSEALAVSRVEQKNVLNWKNKKKK